MPDSSTAVLEQLPLELTSPEADEAAGEREERFVEVVAAADE